MTLPTHPLDNHDLDHLVVETANRLDRTRAGDRATRIRDERYLVEVQQLIAHARQQHEALTAINTIANRQLAGSGRPASSRPIRLATREVRHRGALYSQRGATRNRRAPPRA